MPFTVYAEDPEVLDDAAVTASLAADGAVPTLGDLLAGHGIVLSEKPLTSAHLSLPATSLRLTVLEARPNVAMYMVPGIGLRSRAAADGGLVEAATVAERSAPASASPPPQPAAVLGDLSRHPERITDRDAVLLAHDADIASAATYLESRMSVLVHCEKILVNHLAEEIATASGLTARMIKLELVDSRAAPAPHGVGSREQLPGNRRAELMEKLLAAIAAAEDGELLVVANLDLLAGGTDNHLTAEGRELTDALYEKARCVLLGFCDPSLHVPEVLASRFAVRLRVDILPRMVGTPDNHAPVGRALVTQDEADLFEGYDEGGLYKHVAGLNAVRLRQGLRFASSQYRGAVKRPSVADLVRELQKFKVKTSNSFEVPNVPRDAIGGYKDVQDELLAAVEIINGSAELPEDLRSELVPAGFIFHGPPGTGKTLFAKWIATRLEATVLVVSGPEITDKYVGESERKVRELFADARRNAPSVVVFDEFDSIAAQRSGRDDGGSRAGNAVVAQLLTELDGFRPEVATLIIGTTNRLDLIDEALLRPSRFRPIEIGLPTQEARFEIAKHHAGHFRVRHDEHLLRLIAEATENFSGDDIRSIFRDARSAELTGSKVPADARKLGELVGALRRGRQERTLRRSGRSAAPHVATDGVRTRLRDLPTGASAHRGYDREAARAAAATARTTAPRPEGET